MRFAQLTVLALAIAFSFAAGCEDGGETITDRTVQVGCGMCRFHREGASPGCYWAADFDGKVVPVRGDALPADHDSHAPDGMCNVTRDAVVSGTLHAGWFEATKFELAPVAPAEHPEFDHHDEH
jgi:hypothetical protein